MTLDTRWPSLTRSVVRIVVVVAVLRAAAAQAYPCEADIKRLCGDVQPGGGRIQACLKEHAKDLSPECAARSQAVARNVGDTAGVCRPDVNKHCAGVEAGQGRVLRCLEQHKDELSPACRKSVERTRPPSEK
jgi:hypothetical protein